MNLKHSIGHLALAILACAVSARAITAPSPLWATSIFTLAFAMLVLALVGACLGRGSVRAACAGAAICGWAYLFAIDEPWAAEKIGPNLVTNACIDLLYPAIARAAAPRNIEEWTAARNALMLKLYGLTPSSAGANDPALRGLDRKLDDLNVQAAEFGASRPLANSAGIRWAAWTEPAGSRQQGSIGYPPAPEPFRRIGHGLFAIAFALAGGAFGRFIAGRGMANEVRSAGA